MSGPATTDIECFLRNHAAIDISCTIDCGSVIGKWRVVAFIGKGGNGEVYRVVDDATGGVGALKISLGVGLSSNRVLREIEFLKVYGGGCFPYLYESGEYDSKPYFVMEYLEPLELPSKGRAIEKFILKVAQAVSQLHNNGYIHRDIKPSNVMCRAANGVTEFVLIDLGLLKRHSESREGLSDVSVTIVNGVAARSGTLRYAAPEQFYGGELSPAVDIHALGMLANECFGDRMLITWRLIIREGNKFNSGDAISERS